MVLNGGDPTKMYDYDVFMSYSEADVAIVKPLVQELSSSGLRIFWSDAVLRDRLGEDWYDVIEHSLQNSRHMIVAWSIAAAKSKWVKREYQAFHTSCYEAGDRRLIPVLLEGMTPADLPVFLRQLQVFALFRRESRRQLITLLGGRDMNDLREENARLRRQIVELSHPTAQRIDEEFGDYDSLAKSSGSIRKHQTYFSARLDRPSKMIQKALATYVVQQYLSPGDSVILDSGSMCASVAEEMAAQALSNPGLFYTIMTHNYAAFQTFVSQVPREAINVFFAGGRYDESLNSVLGWPTVKAYEEFTASVAILSASALTSKEGVFTHGNTEEREIKRLLFCKPTTRRILIVGSNKIGKLDSFLVARTEALRNDTEQCVLVTNAPSRKLTGKQRTKINSQLEQLTNMGGIGVALVDVP